MCKNNFYCVRRSEKSSEEPTYPCKQVFVPNSFLQWNFSHSSQWQNCYHLQLGQDFSLTSQVGEKKGHIVWKPAETVRQQDLSAANSPQAEGPLKSFLFEVACLFIFFQVCHIKCYVLLCLDFVSNQNFSLQESLMYCPPLVFKVPPRQKRLAGEITARKVPTY